MPNRFEIPIPKAGPFNLCPDSQRDPEVPRGLVTKSEWRSSIYAGTLRDYYIYVPAQYTPTTVTNVMIFQDGWDFLNEEGDVRASIVFDNLIHQGRLPITIGVFINPGYFPPATDGIEPGYNRFHEYDTLSAKYARFLSEEILPDVGRQYSISNDANTHGLCGASSGGLCSWTAAWERPDIFRKVISCVGSFTDICGGNIVPNLVRKSPPKPIRVYLQAGSNDLDMPVGNWPLANLEMAAALNFSGYDYHLEYGDGGHNYKHCGAILPEALTWLWR